MDSCRDKATGGLIYINYTGVLDVTPELVSVLGGKEDAKTTQFGGACELSPIMFELFLASNGELVKRLILTAALIVIEMRFETGEEKLKDLELGTFVGAGRFLVEEGKPVTVEYKLSKVVKG